MTTRSTKTSLSGLSHRSLMTELGPRARRAATLQRRRDRLAGRIAAFDDQVRALGGASARRAALRDRPRNESTLPQALHALLTGKTMRVTDAAEAVRQAGYRTSSRSFRVQCNIALIKNPKLFKRVGRGEYTAK